VLAEICVIELRIFVDLAREKPFQTLGPRFAEIEAELAALTELREKPAGTIRLTATEYAADTILWPKLAKVRPEYPNIKVEIIIEQALSTSLPSDMTRE
jgi:DNA-binding transcriptional LysR family regulator